MSESLDSLESRSATGPAARSWPRAVTPAILCSCHQEPTPRWAWEAPQPTRSMTGLSPAGWWPSPCPATLPHTRSRSDTEVAWCGPTTTASRRSAAAEVAVAGQPGHSLVTLDSTDERAVGTVAVSWRGGLSRGEGLPGRLGQTHPGPG